MSVPAVGYTLARLPPQTMLPRCSSTLIIAAPFANAGAYDYKVCLLKRDGKGTFKNAYVFPGGVLEDVDHAISDRHFKGFGGSKSPMDPLSPNRFDTVAMRVCAVREAFEESGAQAFTTTVAPAWRQRVAEDSQAYLRMCEEELSLPSVGNLHFWYSFITPDSEARRMKKGGFATAFYLTVLDADVEGMECCGTETTRLVWVTPQEALQQYEAGEISMFPPQWTIMKELEPVHRRAELPALAASEQRTLLRDHVIKPYVLKPDDMDAPAAKGKVVMAYPGDELHPDYPVEGGQHRLVLSVLSKEPFVRATNLDGRRSLTRVTPEDEIRGQASKL